jgi:hypothetical protein
VQENTQSKSARQRDHIARGEPVGPATLPALTLRRRIFRALRLSQQVRPGGIVRVQLRTTKDLALICGAHLPSVANMCSVMESAGLVDRPHGPRRGYQLVVDMLPEDVGAIDEMVATYGADRVRKMMSP